MKKVFVLLVMLMCAVSLASAGLYDEARTYYSNKITGKAVTNTCSDTDGGLNYHMIGRTRVQGQPYYDDACRGDNFLNEYYCAAQNQAQRAEYNCPDGCETTTQSVSSVENGQPTSYTIIGGKCKIVRDVINDDNARSQGAQADCIDTDGGRDKEYVVGKVTARSGAVHVDVCQSNRLNKLNEYYCENNNALRAEYTCVAGCETVIEGDLQGGRCRRDNVIGDAPAAVAPAAGVAGRLAPAAGVAGRLAPAAGVAGRLAPAAGVAGRLAPAAGAPVAPAAGAPVAPAAGAPVAPAAEAGVPVVPSIAEGDYKEIEVLLKKQIKLLCILVNKFDKKHLPDFCKSEIGSVK